MFRFLLACAVLLGAIEASAFTGEEQEQVVGSRDYELGGYAPINFGTTIDEARRILGDDGLFDECRVFDEQGNAWPVTPCARYVQYTPALQTAVTQLFPGGRAGLAIASFTPLGATGEMTMDECPAVADVVLRGATGQFGHPDGPLTEHFELDRSSEDEARIEVVAAGSPFTWFVRHWRWTFEHGGVVTLEQRAEPYTRNCYVRVFYRPKS